MSAVLGNIKYRVDENEAVKFNNVKKIGGEVLKSEAVTKRAALGNLQNRVLPRAGVGKDAIKKDLKEVKLPAIRAAKPRVDSHWKKNPLTSNGTTTTTHTASVKLAGATTLSQAGRVLTRSNSLRITSTRSSGNLAQNVENKEIKTVTTKVVENKLQQVKIVNKEKALPAETKLRREDSNLSRKSLTKLKAVLARETSKTTAVKTTTAVIKAVKSETVSQIKKDAEIEAKVEKTISQLSKTNVRTIRPASHSTALLKGVRNIDEVDGNSLILVSEYVNDIYDYLFQLEREQPVRKHHLSDQVSVTPQMRAVLLDWIHEVHLQFHLVIETFHMTVGIIDRYLQVVKDTKRTHLQLVGVTALFIAAKYEELYPPAINDFIFMTDHSYTQEQIVEMEMKVFKTLDCNLSRPVSIHFLRRFSKAADIQDDAHAMSKYFLELTSIDYDMASYRPSEIAAASLFLTLHLHRGNKNEATGFNDDIWDATLQYYSHYKPENLRPITRKIAKIARDAPNAKLNAVYTKYQSSKFFKASLRPELDSALMDSIIKNDA